MFFRAGKGLLADPGLDDEDDGGTAADTFGILIAALMMLVVTIEVSESSDNDDARRRTKGDPIGEGRGDINEDTALLVLALAEATIMMIMIVTAALTVMLCQ